MAPDPIDRISVEIETSSTVAENGVSALVRSLESLNSVLNKIADTDAAKALKNVGKTAQKASAETSVQAKQSVLTRATRTVRESPAAKQQEQIRQSVRYSRVPNSAAQKEWAQTVRYLQGNGEKPDLDQKINLSELKKSIKESEKIEIDMMKKLDGFYDKFKSIQGENIIGKNAESALGDAEQKLTQLRDSINETRDAAASLDDILKKIENGNGQDIKQSDINGLIEQYRMAGSAARSAGIEADNAMKTAKDAIAQAQAKADEMRESLFANRTIWSAIKSAASNALEDVKTKLAEAASQSKLLAGAIKLGVPIIGTLGSILGSVLRGGLTLLGKLWSGFKRLASTIAGAVVGGFQKLGSILKTVGGSVLNYVTKPFQRAISVIQKWKKTLARMVFLRVVRSAIKAVTDGFKEGIENLYYFSSLVGTQFAPAMDRLATSSLYLKNSLGAMVGPLIQSLAPVVDFLVDKFVQLLNAINMVFAALGGGGTYTKAIKNAAKYGDDLDQSMGGAADAAKEFQRYLIGIDELNVIPEQSTPGGGGGGGNGLGTDYGSMFEQAPLPDWAKNIKDAINAGDWYGAGELLADKVNTLIDKLQKNAPEWGNKIGKAIQHGIEFSLGFIRRLNIEGLGSSIATIIGNALNNINPKDLGAILASGIKSAFRFAHGFLQGYTGPEIGTYLSGVVNGWFAELRRDGGWQKAGEDLSNAIKGIIDGVSNFLKGLDTSAITQDLKDFFGNIDWHGIWESVKNLAQTAADTIPWKDMLNGLLRFAANALVFLREEILGIPSEQANATWQDLETKLETAGYSVTWIDILSGISAFLGDIVNKITTLIPKDGWGSVWDGVKQSIATALGASNWEDMKEQLKEKVFGVLSEAFKVAGDALYEAIKEEHPNWAALLFPGRSSVDARSAQFKKILQEDGMDAATGWVEMLQAHGALSESAAKSLIDSAANGIVSGATENKTVIDEAASSMVSGIETSFGSMSSKSINILHDMATRIDPEMEYMKQQITNAAEESKLSTTNAFSEMDTSAGTAMTSMETNVNTAWENIKQVTSESSEGVRTKFSTAWGDIKENATTVWTEIKDTASGLWGYIKSSISGNVEDIRSNTKSAWGDIDRSVTGELNNMSSSASSSFGNIKNTVTNANSNIKSSTTSSWNSMRNTVQSSFNGLPGSLQSTFSGLNTSASRWGSDVGISLANGIRSSMSHVINAASSLAGSIRSFLHFSEPDMGPLSDFHTYMPDMMKEIASGINSSKSVALRAVSGFAANMADKMGFITDPQTISHDFSSELSYAVDGPNAGAYSGTYSATGDVDGADVINAVNAIGLRIIRAIESKDFDLYFDTQRVGRSTTEVQNRQNRMYGKSLSNA